VSGILILGIIIFYTLNIPIRKHEFYHFQGAWRLAHEAIIPTGRTVIYTCSHIAIGVSTDIKAKNRLLPDNASASNQPDVFELMPILEKIAA
jgi:hypothetical protein